MDEFVTTYFGEKFPLVDEYDPRVIAFFWEAFDASTKDYNWGWTEVEGRDGTQEALSPQLEDWRFYPVTFMTDEQVKEAGFDPR